MTQRNEKQNMVYLSEIFNLKAQPNLDDPTQLRLARHWPQFIAWYEKARHHHEFDDVARRLGAVCAQMKQGGQLIVVHVLSATWHAAQWHTECVIEKTDRPDMYFEESASLTHLRLWSELTSTHLQLLATCIDNGSNFTRKYGDVVSSKELREFANRLKAAKSAIADVVPLSVGQVGPFLFRGGKHGRTRVQDAATLLGADIAIAFKTHQLKMDWELVSRLADIAGMIEREAQTIRTAASRLIKAEKARDITYIGWPLDVGGLASDLPDALEEA